MVADDFASVAAAVVAGDDLLAKENAQLSAQGLVDSVAASLADGGDAAGQQALLAFGSSNSAAAAAVAAAAAALCGDLINNNNAGGGSAGGGGGGGGGGCGSGQGSDCATKLEYALMGGQPMAEEPRFVTSAAANPLLVEKLMSKCLNIEKRMDKLSGKSRLLISYLYTSYSLNLMNNPWYFARQKFQKFPLVLFDTESVARPSTLFYMFIYSAVGSLSTM